MRESAPPPVFRRHGRFPIFVLFSLKSVHSSALSRRSAASSAAGSLAGNAHPPVAVAFVPQPAVIGTAVSLGRKNPLAMEGTSGYEL